jgi:putrescine transport system substrate-binding protein
MKSQSAAVVLSLCALLAACGNKDKEQAAAPAGAAAPAAAPISKTLNVYNYSDYIAEDVIPGFEAKSGVKVTYDVYDSDEVVEAKLLAGSSGYDIVVPTLNFFGRQIQAVMQRIAQQDPGNQYGVPYMSGTTGIGYNVDKVKKAFGTLDVVNSWDLVFKPENISKLKSCGVTLLDTPSDLIPIALHYLGENPNSTDPKVIDKAAALLKSIRPYIQNFHSSQLVGALANGNTCLVVAWSGDVIQARDRAAEAKNGVNIGYSIPKEGAPQWFDMLAIPKDAKNVENAYAFINYLLDPKVAASNTNFIHYANPVPSSLPDVSEDIRNDPTIYPPAEVAAKLFSYSVVPPEVDRQYTRIWTELKTGK